MHTTESLDALLVRVRACQLCAAHLPLGPRPVLQAATGARILIAGQAPGRKVHASGIPFDDASGERLRAWMGISRTTFYDPHQVAILPMGFCYPGTGRSGDLPPRPECAPACATTAPRCWRCRTPARAITAGCGITRGLRKNCCQSCVRGSPWHCGGRPEQAPDYCLSTSTPAGGLNWKVAAGSERLACRLAKRMTER